MSTEACGCHLENGKRLVKPGCKSHEPMLNYKPAAYKETDRPLDEFISPDATRIKFRAYVCVSAIDLGVWGSVTAYCRNWIGTPCHFGLGFMRNDADLSTLEFYEVIATKDSQSNTGFKIQIYRRTPGNARIKDGQNGRNPLSLLIEFGEDFSVTGYPIQFHPKRLISRDRLCEGMREVFRILNNREYSIVGRNCIQMPIIFLRTIQTDLFVKKHKPSPANDRIWRVYLQCKRAYELNYIPQTFELQTVAPVFRPEAHPASANIIS